MRSALIGLGLVSATYADVFRNSEDVSLHSVYARSADARQAILDRHPDLCAIRAASIEDVAVRTGRAPLVSGRDALQVHRLITALELSGKDGVRVALKDV